MLISSRQTTMGRRRPTDLQDDRFFGGEREGGVEWASWSPVESGNIRSSASKLEQAASEPIATLQEL